MHSKFCQVKGDSVPAGKKPETTLQYLLRCELYLIYELELLNDICAFFEEFIGRKIKSSESFNLWKTSLLR